MPPTWRPVRGVTPSTPMAVGGACVGWRRAQDFEVFFAPDDFEAEESFEAGVLRWSQKRFSSIRSSPFGQTCGISLKIQALFQLDPFGRFRPIPPT